MCRFESYRPYKYGVALGVAPIRFYLLFYLEDGVGGDGAVGGGVEALDGGKAHAVGAGFLDVEVIFYGVGA